MEKRRNSTMAGAHRFEPELVKMRISRLKDDKLVDIERLERQTNLVHEIFNNQKGAPVI